MSLTASIRLTKRPAASQLTARLTLLSNGNLLELTLS